MFSKSHGHALFQPLVKSRACMLLSLLDLPKIGNLIPLLGEMLCSELRVLPEGTKDPAQLITFFHECMETFGIQHHDLAAVNRDELSAVLPRHPQNSLTHPITFAKPSGFVCARSKIVQVATRNKDHFLSFVPFDKNFFQPITMPPLH